MERESNGDAAVTPGRSGGPSPGATAGPLTVGWSPPLLSILTGGAWRMSQAKRLKPRLAGIFGSLSSLSSAPSCLL